MKNKNTKQTYNKDIWQKANNIASFVLILLSVLSPIFCGGFEYIYTLPVSMVVLVCAFINLNANKDYTQSKSVYWIMFAGLLAILILTVFSPNVYLSLGTSVTLAAGLFGFLISGNIFKDKKFITFFAIALTVICGCISLWMFRNCAISAGGGALFWEKLSTGKLDRIFGTYINPNFYAGYLAMCFPISIGLLFTFKEAKYAYLFGFISVFILINLCLTGSKFGMIALFMGLLAMFFCLLYTKAFNKQTIKTLISIGAVCIVFFCLFSQTLILRIETANTTQAHSTEFRISTWKSTINMICHNPIIGVFPGRFAEVYPKYTVAATTKHAHSSYLQFASEFGVILFILLILGLFAVAKNIPKIKNQTNENYEFIDSNKLVFLYSGIIGGFVAEIIHSLVDSDLYICSHLFIFTLICGILFSFKEKEETPKFLKDTGKNLALIFLIGCVWLMISVILFARKDWTESYKIFPNNYMALREMAGSTYSQNTKTEYLNRAKDKAPKDYMSYQLLGDNYLYDNFDLALINYEKALEYHPHSTLNMTKIINLAEQNNKSDLIEKYSQKLIAQEDTPYEKLKGVPELVDISYCKANIYMGDKAMKENKKEEALTYYKKAKNRYENWIMPENLNFLMVSLFNGQSSKESYEKNYSDYKDLCLKLEILEKVSYNDKIQLFRDKLDYIYKQISELNL